MSTDAEMPTTQAPSDQPPARKFMFDRSFDDAQVVHRAERRPVLMKPEQIDALKKEAHDLGFVAGKTAGKDEIIAQQNAILSKIDHNIGTLIKGLHAISQEQEEHARSLSIAIVKKLFPTFSATNGPHEIEALIDETLKDMKHEPRLVVRIHESAFDTLNEKIQDLATHRAYPGKVVVIADTDVAQGDCRIEWSDGGIERNVSATMTAIEQNTLPSS